jgi:CheY-like chemotaxis protein
MSGNRCTACRVLVVEDELVIAVTIEDVLRALGCEIVGPVATVEKALKLARDETFDVAILDVTIRGGKVYPVAELLLARGIPLRVCERVWRLGASGSPTRPTPSDETLHSRRTGRADQAALQRRQSPGASARWALKPNRTRWVGCGSTKPGNAGASTRSTEQSFQGPARRLFI